MKLIRGLHNISRHTSHTRGRAITIGNFDGVHTGHQKIIQQLTQQAQKLQLRSLLISFSPTPKVFFNQGEGVLSNFQEKYHLLDKLGLDEHLIIAFNQSFSELSADDFLQQILLHKLKMKYCLIGDDFHFGAGRLGDFGFLQRASKHHEFEIQRIDSVLFAQRRVSSSKIRSLLTAGDFATAAQFLGREFSISGKIIRGAQKGRTIDFPTINIPIKRQISPVSGVFAVRVILEGKIYQGVCNVGNRPTVGGQKILLEVFLFEFSQTVYGKWAQVIFKHKLRDEQKFASFLDLKQQIKLDTERAKTFFAHVKD